MTEYSIDLLYAWQRLGLEPGASLPEIDAVLKKYPRPPRVQDYIAFFYARKKLGGIFEDFVSLRKAHRRKAFALHPDRNQKNEEAEEELKSLNAAYDLVTKIHRQAKEFYQSEETKKQSVPKSPGGKRPPHPSKAEAPRHPQGQRFMAMSMLRTVRRMRLRFLPFHAVIGSITVKRKNDLNLIYDIIMLPASQFMRVRANLASPSMPGSDLNYGAFDAPYIPQNIREFIVPEDEEDSGKAAKEYFRKLFRADT